MSHSTRSEHIVSHALPRNLSLLITARDSYFGSCTCLFSRFDFVMIYVVLVILGAHHF
jgi:hypothetical protein